MEKLGKSSAQQGLLYVLIATVIAGIAGYIIQGVVPVFVGGPENYLPFSVFWSALYLIIAALSGIQQELSRAVHPADPYSVADRSSQRSIWLFASGTIGSLLFGMGITGFLWAPSLFHSGWRGMLVALTIGVSAYVAVAVISGILYGLSIWWAIATTAIVDALVRLALIIVVGMLNPTASSLAWAVIVPFPITAFITWLVVRRRIHHSYALDVPLKGLIRNSSSTVLASVATGLLTSGFAVAIKLTSQSDSATAIGTLVFVLTLTRAPLVVPIMALQSYLTVQFRGRTDVLQKLLQLSAILLAAGLVIAALAVPFVPWILSILWPQYTVSSGVAFGTVLSALATAMLCLSGPAILAQSYHRAFVGGWLIAALAMIGFLFLPLPTAPRILVALSVGPVLGYIFHVGSLIQISHRRPAGD